MDPKHNEELEPFKQDEWDASCKDKKHAARAAMRSLGLLMKKAVNDGVEEFSGESRVALLYSTFHIRNPMELATLLKWTVELVLRVENWCDAMRPRKPSKVELEAESIAATQTYLSEFRLTVDAQGTSEDERAVAHTLDLLEKRREMFHHKIDDENAAFEKEVIDPIVKAANDALNALTELVDFVTSPRSR